MVKCLWLWTLGSGENKTTKPKKINQPFKSTQNYKPRLSKQPNTEQITSSMSHNSGILDDSTGLIKQGPTITELGDCLGELYPCDHNAKPSFLQSRPFDNLVSLISDNVHKVLSFTIQWASSSKYLVIANSATVWPRTHLSSHVYFHETSTCA